MISFRSTLLLFFLLVLFLFFFSFLILCLLDSAIKITIVKERLFFLRVDLTSTSRMSQALSWSEGAKLRRLGEKVSEDWGNVGGSLDSSKSGSLFSTPRVPSSRLEQATQPLTHGILCLQSLPY